MQHLGNFWCQVGSPFSLRAYWAVVHSRVSVCLVPCIPIISTFLLWIRLGFKTRSSPLSLPVLFPSRTSASTRVVRSSTEVARLADSKRRAGTPSLFPPRSTVHTDRFMRAADSISQFGRLRLLQVCVDDPKTAARFLLPQFMRTWVFVPAMLRMASKFLRRKYPDKSTREDVRQALLQLREALEKNGGKYVFGQTFTYADICMASSIFFAVERREGSAAKTIYDDDALYEEFSDIVAWRKRMFEVHYPGSERDAFKFKPPVYKDE